MFIVPCSTTNTMRKTASSQKVVPESTIKDSTDWPVSSEMLDEEVYWEL
jgi:hypothetical protein